jgi:hypothetical protein
MRSPSAKTVSPGLVIALAAALADHCAEGSISTCS